MKKGKIVVLDDNQNVLNALGLLLRTEFEEHTLISSPQILPATLREKRPDVVLLDMNFKAGVNTGNEGLYWLSEVKRLYPDMPVVLFTAYADIDLAVEALKRGASDFVVKPWDNAKLLESLRSAMGGTATSTGTKAPNTPTPATTIALGRSPAMQRVVEIIRKVAPTDANLLITGENGTGKEVVARYAHSLSLRSDRPLVTVDMGAITESLFESEVFGHVKGAFTDARTDRAGKIESADGGTLFMDEIGNLRPSLQAKLLVALERREVVRVGSNRPIPFDVRLISATNGRIFDKVESGEFREDLLYRINTIHIEIPPLRSRPEDIEELAVLFAREFGEKYGKPSAALSPDALRRLHEHSWPGNVRELRHAIEKAVILCDGSEISAQDFLFDCVRQSVGDGTPVTLEAMERQLILRSLERTGYNISLSAEELGISRPTLYSKIKKYEL